MCPRTCRVGCGAPAADPSTSLLYVELANGPGCPTAADITSLATVRAPQPRIFITLNSWFVLGFDSLRVLCAKMYESLVFWFLSVFLARDP